MSKEAFKAGLAVTAIGLFGAAQAEASPVGQNQANKRLERRLEGRLQHRQPVQFDTNFNYVWAPPDAKHRYEHITGLPILAEDQGRHRYFELVQKGGSLASLDVVELPRGGARVESLFSTSFHCGAEPNHSGVISLNQHDQPVTTLRYNDGTVYHEVQVGLTRPYVSYGPILAPPLVPGQCPPYKSVP